MTMNIDLRIGLCNSFIQVPIDDYIFHAVMRRGPVVSKPGRPMYIEVMDFSESPVTHSVVLFRMSLLDASIVSEAYPDFDTTGIPAIWQLQTNGTLKFNSYMPKTYESVQSFLLDAQSNAFLRERYKISLEDSFIKDSIVA